MSGGSSGTKAINGTLLAELAAIIDNLTEFTGNKIRKLAYVESIPMLNSLLERLRYPKQVRHLAVK